MHSPIYYHRRIAMMSPTLRLFLRLLVVFGAAGWGPGVNAAETPAASTPQVWLNPGLYSYHFDRNKGFRENNIGFGAEVLLAEDHMLMAGTFINSDRAHTRYGAYQWRPLHWQPAAGIKVSLGVAASGFDGYPRYHNGGWFLAALPLLAIEGDRIGANLVVIPTISDRLNGAVAIQVKLRVW